MFTGIPNSIVAAWVISVVALALTALLLRKAHDWDDALYRANKPICDLLNVMMWGILTLLSFVWFVGLYYIVVRMMWFAVCGYW